MSVTATTRHAVHRSFKTSDPDCAHAHVEDTFAIHDLSLGSSDVRFRLDSASTERVTVGRMAYGTRAQITGPSMRDCYHVNLLVSGGCKVAQNGSAAVFSAGDQPSGVVFGPDGEVLINWSADCAQYHMKLNRSDFELHAARLVGHATPSTIDFDLTFPLDTPAGRSLSSSVAFYYSQLAADGGLATMPAVQVELESALMTQVLLVANNNLTAQLHRDVAATDDHTIDDVINYIDRNAQADLSIASLAERFGITARTIQLGFRRVVDTTPSEYIRMVRLDGAHHDLSVGAGQSVSDIAHRWRFGHLGRFAAQYRERFGRSPSETLRRG